MDVKPYTETELCPYSPKYIFFLCLFLGVLGAHRFYVKKNGTGLLMLLTLGGLGFWTIIDLMFIVNNKFEDKQNRTVLLTRNSSNLKKAMMVIGSILAEVAIIFTVIYGIAVFSSRHVLMTVENELKALRAQDINQAYSYTSTEFRKGTSLKDYEYFISQYPFFRDYQYFSVNKRAVKYENGVSTGYIAGTLDLKDGKKIYIQFMLVKEQGIWKILNMHFGTKPPISNDE